MITVCGMQIDTLTSIYARDLRFQHLQNEATFVAFVGLINYSKHFEMIDNQQEEEEDVMMR